MWINNEKFTDKLKESYDAGLAKGYELGFMMGKTESSNKGFIIGSKVDRQIREILRRGDR